MAEVSIEVVDREQLPVIVNLFNQIFRPPRELGMFERRFLGRHNILRLIARVRETPVGFFLGFELKPTVFFAWFYGVLMEYRRQGIASQLMDAAHQWAQKQDYKTFRVECHNTHRPLLHLNIALGYNIVGLRWDGDRGENLIIFEKSLHG